MDSDYRYEIIQLVKSEFIGPCPDENPIEGGEEVIEGGDTPLARYSAGILYPQLRTVDEIGNDEGCRNQGADQSQEEAPLDIRTTELTTEDEPEDDPVTLSNAYHQSAVSLTVAVSPSATLVTLRVDFARYVKSSSREDGTGSARFSRVPMELDCEILPEDFPKPHTAPMILTQQNFGALSLELLVTNRETKDPRTKGMYTFSLVNTSESDRKFGDDERCAFQVEFTVGSDAGFLPVQDGGRSGADDEDYRNNQLLYRDIKAYGIGHGCAAAWNQNEREVTEVRASFMPVYEVRPVVPGASDLVFDMLEMSVQENKDATIQTLEELCKHYANWIGSIGERSNTLSPELADTARANIANCRDCLSRMEEGVQILRADALAFEAFALMNEAMLLQQLHYRLPLAPWRGDFDGGYEGLGQEPIAANRTTWPKDGTVYGRWRTFQIAFILMNLKSMRDDSCTDRDLIDLIWFPTGGGKTEAYLGLTAFTLFIRRLLDKNDSGVTVLMRYTLRLLTTQQFERASSLICACETIRERMPERLGRERFSIGLWVGKAATPNTQEDARHKLDAMKRGGTDENPFVLLKCPWCGAAMGINKCDRGRPMVLGYKECAPNGGRRGNRKVRYVCSNHGCHFSKDGKALPIYSIDEDIYEQRPSLVIGTVDKFATITATPETRNLFGRGEHECTPPDLIIQDELHLISGPLGSMVGFYETAIDALCTDANGRHAKIIGSTATISHAKEQCSQLYCREKSSVRQFPPSGIDARDSFFAVEEPDLEKPGRLYVGICAPGHSTAMTVIDLYASLLLAHDVAVEADDGKKPSADVLDGYVTNLAYFNSLRELGRAATWISGNILENFKTMQTRRWRKDSSFGGRPPSAIKSSELTSRVPSSKIPKALQDLGASYEEGQKLSDSPIDICLATSMVSVGVDIQRLALMTIDGQPKTTSEYIQVSSRVGRGMNPGLVFTVYSPTKARDKSHYEDFQRYHSKLYCSVEPTSVTPFSAPLRDRALRALFVALVRQLCPYQDRDDPGAPSDELFQTVEDIIVERAKAVDPDEADSTKRQVRELAHRWRTMHPQAYTSKQSDETTPLIMRVGSAVNPAWQRKRIWEVPSSMRSVDTDCRIRQIDYYRGSKDVDQ